MQAPGRIMEAADGGWRSEMRFPGADLAPYVRDFQGYSERVASMFRRLELPHGGVVLVINFGARWTVADPRRERDGLELNSFVAGIDDFASLVSAGGRADCLQINLTPVGARRFFGIGMHELARRVVDLRDVLGVDADRLADRLHQAPAWSARFDIAERILRARIEDGPAAAGRVLRAWQLLERSGGRARIGAITRELGCSRKHLAELFRDQVGLPPKTVAGILRFARAVQTLEGGAPNGLARVATDCGYSDQAHFNRDFLSLAGITPGGFLRARLPDGGGVLA